MAFRHPPPWIFWLAFGGPVVVGLLGAFDVWRSASNDTSPLARIGVTVAAAVVPLTAMIVLLCFSAFVMIYLGTSRKGNTIVVTGGEHEGKTAIVTKRHGLTDHGWVQVRLIDEELDTTISPYQVKKVGLWSHLL